MGGQLDRNFLAGSLPHKFIILIVTSFICLWSINFFPLSLCPYLPARLSVCLSVCHKLSLHRNNGMDRAGSWHFRLSHTAVYGNLGSAKVKVLPYGTLSTCTSVDFIKYATATVIFMIENHFALVLVSFKSIMSILFC